MCPWPAPSALASAATVSGPLWRTSADRKDRYVSCEASWLSWTHLLSQCCQRIWSSVAYLSWQNTEPSHCDSVKHQVWQTQWCQRLWSSLVYLSWQNTDTSQCDVLGLMDSAHGDTPVSVHNCTHWYLDTLTLTSICSHHWHRDTPTLTTNCTQLYSLVSGQTDPH